MNIRNSRIRVEGINLTSTVYVQFDRVRELAGQIDAAGGFVDGGGGIYRFAVESGASPLNEYEIEKLEVSAKQAFMRSLHQ